MSLPCLKQPDSIACRGDPLLELHVLHPGGGSETAVLKGCGSNAVCAGAFSSVRGVCSLQQVGTARLIMQRAAGVLELVSSGHWVAVGGSPGGLLLK